MRTRCAGTDPDVPTADIKRRSTPHASTTSTSSPTSARRLMGHGDYVAMNSQWRRAAHQARSVEVRILTDGRTTNSGVHPRAGGSGYIPRCPVRCVPRLRAGMPLPCSRSAIGSTKIWRLARVLVRLRTAALRRTSSVAFPADRTTSAAAILVSAAARLPATIFLAGHARLLPAIERYGSRSEHGDGRCREPPPASHESS